MRRVIFRADDAGASVGTNDAMIEVVSGGLIQNVGIMAPGLAFEDAKRLMDLDACLGMHAVLNAEWDGVKWGPVASNVPSLVDENGHFLPTPMRLHERGFSLAEAERELRAQLARLLDAGFRLSYLDDHMGVAWLPGLREVFERIAAEHGLVYAPTIPFWDPFSGSEAPEGEVALMVYHPSTDDADSALWWHTGLPPGKVARDRDAERRFLAKPPALDGIRSIRYSEQAD